MILDIHHLLVGSLHHLLVGNQHHRLVDSHSGEDNQQVAVLDNHQERVGHLGIHHKEQDQYLLQTGQATNIYIKLRVAK